MNTNTRADYQVAAARSCLDGNVIQDLVAGRLVGSLRQRCLSHLDVCSTCLECVVLARTGDVRLFAGRYRREEQPVGVGASGSVYRAYDTREQRWVALKLLHPHLCGAPQMDQLLQAELCLMRRIRHPHVCSVLDGGQVDDQVFLVMELAEHSLEQEWKRTQRATPWQARFDDFTQILSGIAALHSAGIVHRDLKPGNVLRMPDGRLVIADFGLAVDLKRAAGDTAFVGTLGYMAPERALALRVTPSADVWSLGVLLHQMLFDRAPRWTGSRRRLSAPAISSDGRSRSLELLLGRCLAYDVRRRLRDACVLAERVAAIRRQLECPMRSSAPNPDHARESFHAARCGTPTRALLQFRQQCEAEWWYVLTEFARAAGRRARILVRAGATVVRPILRHLSFVAGVVLTIGLLRNCSHVSSERHLKPSAATLERNVIPCVALPDPNSEQR